MVRWEETSGTHFERKYCFESYQFEGIMYKGSFTSSDGRLSMSFVDSRQYRDACYGTLVSTDQGIMVAPWLQKNFRAMRSHNLLRTSDAPIPQRNF